MLRNSHAAAAFGIICFVRKPLSRPEQSGHSHVCCKIDNFTEEKTAAVHSFALKEDNGGFLTENKEKRTFSVF